jgi:glycosyltransferase involved in cell wall biosynthesis
VKIAILGTRGIPNTYGGFEQFAEYISHGLAGIGHEVTVYNPHLYKPEMKKIGKVNIVHIYCPELTIGASAHYIYDFLCLKHAVKNDFDIIYEAGYATASVSYRLKKKGKKPFIITNMDGIEWKRDKWNSVTKLFIKYCEGLAILRSDYIVADNEGIKSYLDNKYDVDSKFVPYGADLAENFDYTVLRDLNIEKHKFMLIIARIEPENNIHLMMSAYEEAKPEYPLIIVGNHTGKYARELEKEFGHNENIRFVGGVYDKAKLDALRQTALCYIHGHKVGGTNPSLLEAMAADAYIIAYENLFNGSVLNSNASFFSNVHQLAMVLRTVEADRNNNVRNYIERNRQVILAKYSWSNIIQQYDHFFNEILNQTV